MKRWISIFLIAVMLLSLAACSDTNDPKETELIGASICAALEQAQNTAKQNPPSKGQSTPKKPAKETMEAPKQSGPAPLQVLLGNHVESEWDDTYEAALAIVDWQSIILGEESAKNFPALAAALQEMNAGNSENNAYLLQDMAEMARETFQEREYPINFESSSHYTVQRADERILSVLVNEYEYMGGVHPMSWVWATNMDPATGYALPLEDVMTDTKVLPEILTKQLQEKYPDIPFENLQETLEDFPPETFAWTIGYQGITFYFSPYVIASYAAGILSTTVWFDEYPQLFEKAYTQAPDGGYAFALTTDTDIAIDLDPKDSQRDVLSLSMPADENYDLHVYATLNGQDFFLEDCRGYEMLPHLVCLRSGDKDRFYLYIEATAENDFTSIYIYDLNNGKLTPGEHLYGAGSAGYWNEEEGKYGTWYETVFNDPTEFVLSSMIERLGTWVATKPYTTDPASGSIVALEDYYTIWKNASPIVSAIELEVTMLPEQKTQLLPAGTTFYYRRTDGISYADLELENGHECRIYFSYEDYTPLINGVPEWDCFEDLLYAG